MKRLPVILLALIACLAVGATAAAAAKNDTRADTGSTVKVKFKDAKPGDPYGQPKFTGKVGPSECAKGRKVKIKKIGSEKTDDRGKFTISASGDVKDGDYKVSVASKGDCKSVKTVITVG